LGEGATFGVVPVRGNQTTLHWRTSWDSWWTDEVAMRAIVEGRLYIHEHPVRFAGGSLLTRMTAIILADGGVILHCPVPVDDALRAEIDRLGPVKALLAPSSCHHVFIPDTQRVFPGVPTYAIEDLRKKRPDLALEPLPDGLWADELDRETIGNRLMREVVFLHRSSRTLIAVDLVENVGDETPGVDGMMRMWLKLLGQWNKPRPAPELRWFTGDRAGARRAIERMLSWDFDKMILAHGEPYERDAASALREAWSFVLRGSPAR
jgi:hypothetical protein